MEILARHELNDARVERRTEELFSAHRQEIYKRTDRLFAGLMLFQWLGAVAAAYWISPKTWAGPMSQTHLHVWAAVFLGGATTWLPVYLALTRPGETATRHVIAAGQALMSALLIHLLGGRLETHFHVFGSLAFLAFYRDWRVLITASAIVALDHALRGAYSPQSVYGVLAASPWRWAEHTAWVVFEDVFLINSCLQSVREMRDIARHRARLERTNELIEETVKSRTEELRRSNQKLHQNEKLAAVGQLAAGVAHEINNPLGVILGFAQAMARQAKTGDPLELPIKSIAREAVRCKNLVQDLLTFARTSQSDREPVDLNQAVKEASSLVRTQARVAQVELLEEFAENLPPMLGNKNQIQQIVINLAKNALDAMPEGGVLAIRTELLEDGPLSWICLKVSDTGMGISSEILPRIFEPFFTSKPVGQGTGLGLSLVHEIVRKHSGEVAVESRPGFTVFTVKFPARTGREAASGAVSPLPQLSKT